MCLARIRISPEACHLFERLKTAIAALTRSSASSVTGLATVYLARDTKHNREVAIKVLLADVGFALGPSAPPREIDLASHLSHPTYCPLRSARLRRAVYVIRSRGESLRGRLTASEQSRSTNRSGCVRGRQRPRSFAPSRIIHRDIKPENSSSRMASVVGTSAIARAVSAMGEEKLTATGFLGTRLT